MLPALDKDPLTMIRTLSVCCLRAGWCGFVCACLWVLVSGELKSFAAENNPIDWEQAVADYHHIQQTILDTQQFNRGNPSAEQIRERNEWIVAQHPGTDLAANIEAGNVVQLWHENKFEHVAPAAMALVAK